MIVIQFRKHFLHYRFAEKHSFRTYTKLLTIMLYSRHLAVIQIDDLPMSAHKRFFLLFKILRINAGRTVFLLSGHFSTEIIFAKVNNLLIILLSL